MATAAVCGIAVATACVLPSSSAMAQGWQWPWQNQQQPAPMPREPVYRPPVGQQPPPSPNGYQGQGYQPPASAQSGARGGGNGNPICLQLEQRLAQDANRGTQSRDQLPKLEAEIRAADRASQQGQAQLERQECFDFFLFSKTLKRTRACVDLNTQVENARRRIAELDTQRQQLISSGGRSYQDDIIRELARNNCGANYQQEANRRGPLSSLWQDEDGGGGNGGQFGNLPFATYKTVCVRLCDGYYFPVSFSTLPNHFERDADACQSKCAAPAELYYHQNPGSSMEQAVSFKSKQNYSSLRTAFRYRKEYIQGCSCKQAEYVPSTLPADRRADVPPGASAAVAPPPRR
ncbi:MAG: DUF2865 domain-containing protein [Hyphomicrobiaceae bacterium]